MRVQFEYLDQESEDLLKELITSDCNGKTYRGTAIAGLVKAEYVYGNDATTSSDVVPVYVLNGLSQRGKSYFELKNKVEKERKRITRREWKIAIISAIIGAIVGLAPTIIQWIKALL